MKRNTDILVKWPADVSAIGILQGAKSNNGRAVITRISLAIYRNCYKTPFT